MIENLYRCKKKVLGSGSYEKVYLVRDASTVKKYAGKEFYDAQINNEEQKIMQLLTHISNLYLS